MYDGAMLAHMRTSFDLPDSVFRQLKQRAARDGVTMRDVVLRALRTYLGGAKARPYVFRWRTTRGEQLIPDDVLASREKLYDWFEQNDEPRDRD